MPAPITDVIDALAGIEPGAALDAIRDRRPQAREQAEASFRALFEPEDFGGVSANRTFAVAVFVTGLHGNAESAAFYAELVRGKSCRRRGRVRPDRELPPAASQHPRFLDQDFRRRATRRASFFSTQRTPQRRRDFAGPHLEFGSADRALRGIEYTEPQD